MKKIIDSLHDLLQLALLLGEAMTWYLWTELEDSIFGYDSLLSTTNNSKENQS